MSVAELSVAEQSVTDPEPTGNLYPLLSRIIYVALGFG